MEQLASFLRVLPARHLRLLDVLVFLVTPAFALALSTAEVRWLGNHPRALLAVTAGFLLIKLGIFYKAGFYNPLARYARADDLADVVALLFLTIKMALLRKARLELRSRRYALLDELVDIGIVSLLVVGLEMIFFYLFLPAIGALPPDMPRSVPWIEAALALIAVCALRLGGPLATRLRRGAAAQVQRTPVLVAGNGVAAAQLVAALQQNPELGWYPIGVLDDAAERQGLRIHGVPVLGRNADLDRVSAQTDAGQLIVAVPAWPRMAFSLLTKRFFDLAIAIPVLILCAPLMVVIAVTSRIILGSPVLFRQERPGLHGRPFTLVKFRSMLPPAHRDGRARTEAERISPYCHFLRHTSLDELPELFSVLRGDMSLVGPRPLLVQYLNRYTPEQMRRHDVKPGITGWAQINGRNAISWERRFELDVWYVDHRSFRLDLTILVGTAWKVLQRADINAEGHATISEFTGPPAAEG